MQKKNLWRKVQDKWLLANEHKLFILKKEMMFGVMKR